MRLFRQCAASNVKSIIFLILLVLPCTAYCGDQWVTVNEGFQIKIPANWKKQNVHGIDSAAGVYTCTAFDLEFDGVPSMMYPPEKSDFKIREFKNKEASPKLLRPDEEIWHVDGRIAHYYAEKTDPKIYGKRPYPYVACLFVPFPEGGYLSVNIYYMQKGDLSVAKTVLKSITWPDPHPTKLTLGIGGFIGASYRIELMDGTDTVRYLSNPNTFTGAPGTKEEKLTIPNERWAKFRERLDKANVWDWKKAYIDHQIVDGTKWHVTIEWAGKKVDSEGSNAYPEPKQFSAFEKAVEELLGGKPFE